MGRSPATAGAAAHVFVDDIDAPILGGEDLHHLRRVLRLQSGEDVTVADGQGTWRSCRFAGNGELEPLSQPLVETRSVPLIAIGFALTKGDRPEWVVQKLTEIGVDRIVPFTAVRTVVRWEGAKAARQAERLSAVARGAAMQSRRAWLPIVENVQSFEEAAAMLGPAAALAHPGGGSRLGLNRPALLVGPEGGFAADELGCGLPLVDLGPTVLRAETAAIAGAVLLCGLRTGVVAPPELD